MHGLLGLAGVLALITLAFGHKAAMVFARFVLLTGAGCFAYVAYRIVSGTI